MVPVAFWALRFQSNWQPNASFLTCCPEPPWQEQLCGLVREDIPSVAAFSPEPTPKDHHLFTFRHRIEAKPLIPVLGRCQMNAEMAYAFRFHQGTCVK